MLPEIVNSRIEIKRRTIVENVEAKASAFEAIAINFDHHDATRTRTFA